MALRSGVVLSLGLCLLVAPAPCVAWGGAGHRVIARIAAKNIDQGTRAKLAVILGVAPGAVEDAMAEASTWPDDIDKVKTGTREWHFINVAVSNPFSTTGLCSPHECVLDRINEMARRLHNNEKGFTLLAPPAPKFKRPMTSREVAFLIHFVGDVHQPLHAADNHDLGGVQVLLNPPIQHGQFPTDQLHALWDGDEVFAVLNALGDERHAAAALNQRFQNGATVVQLTPLDWARESYDLAKQSIYNKLTITQDTNGKRHVILPAGYVDGNEGEVETRLLRAGIRLARLLDQTCAGDGCKAKP